MSIAVNDVVEVVKSAARRGAMGLVIGEAERLDEDRMFVVHLTTGETLTMPEWALRRVAPKERPNR